MPWWGWVLTIWIGTPVAVLTAATAWTLWHEALDRKTVKRQDKRWAADNGIDLHATYGRTLPGARLPE